MSELKTRATIDKKLLGYIDSLKGKLISYPLEEGLFIGKWVLDNLKFNEDNEKEALLRSKIKLKLATKESLRKNLRKVAKTNFPYNLKFGEIINVKFGLGVGDELKSNHYGVILSRKGKMFLVAPLTSQELDFGVNTVSYEDLGLPNSKKTFVSFSQIRYVHERRITKIDKLPEDKDGRLKLEVEQAIRILDNYNKIIVDGIELE